MEPRMMYGISEAQKEAATEVIERCLKPPTPPDKPSIEYKVKTLEGLMLDHHRLLTDLQDRLDVLEKRMELVVDPKRKTSTLPDVDLKRWDNDDGWAAVYKGVAYAVADLDSMKTQWAVRRVMIPRTLYMVAPEKCTCVEEAVVWYHKRING